MGIQNVSNKDYLFRPLVQRIGSITENFRKIQCRSDLRYNSLSFAFQWFGNHKDIRLRNAPFRYKPQLDFVFFMTSQMVLSVM